MKTKTIGEILQEEREFRRLTLEEFSKRTRIKKEYLEALEANKFQELPAATFIKGYIKSYAQLLGFDDEPLIALLRRDYKESAKGRLVPREFLRPALKRRALSQPFTLAILAVAAVFLTLFGYVAVQWYGFNQPPALSLSTPQEDATVAAQVVVAGETETEATVLVNAQPVAIQADGSFKTEVFIPREGLSTITVEAQNRRGRKAVLQRTVTVQF